jgi:hypothetical protein
MNTIVPITSCNGETTIPPAVIISLLLSEWVQGGLGAYSVIVQPSRLFTFSASILAALWKPFASPV